MILASAIEFVAEDASKQPTWYQAFTGILGIPVAVFTIIGAWFLVKKTRRETRKLDLEIEEKERALGEARRKGDALSAVGIMSGPLFEGRRIQDILARFILLSLVQQVWGVVNGYFGALPSVAQVSFAKGDITVLTKLLYAGATLLSVVPDIGYWVLFTALGWPLLLDVADLLRIGFPDWVRTRKMGRAVMFTAFVGAILGNAAQITPIFAL